MALLLCLIILSLEPGSDILARASALSRESYCEASSVVEGEPLTMTFNLRKTLDTTSPSFYAYMRGRASPGKDIITCDGLQLASGKECKVMKSYPMFQVINNLQRNRLVVQISNMSRDLVDTYFLRAFFNNSDEPAISCLLKLASEETTTSAFNDENEGSLGSIAVPIILVLVIAIAILAILFWKRRRGKTPATQTEDRPQTEGGNHMGEIDESSPPPENTPLMENEHTSPPKHPVPAKRQPKSNQNDQQDQPTPSSNNSKPDIQEAANIVNQGQSQSLAEETPQSPQPHSSEEAPSCHKRSPEKPVPAKRQPKSKQNDQHDQPTPSSNNRSTGEQNNKDSHEQKRWFAGRISNDEVDTMFQYKKNGEGSFVITQSKKNTKSFTLAVRFKDGTRAPERLTITQTESGAFTLQETGDTFKTLCDLVDEFRRRPIIIGGQRMGKLSKPCVEKPSGEWYFGPLQPEEIDTRLLGEETQEGCFLVADSIIRPENYTLAVKFGDRVKKFTIVFDDDGFKIQRQKTRQSFRALRQLVEHYKASDLEDSMVWGKLGIPCVRK